MKKRFAWTWLCAIGLIGFASTPTQAAPVSVSYLFSGTVASSFYPSFSNGSFGFSGNPAGMPWSATLVASGLYDTRSSLRADDDTTSYFSDARFSIVFNGQTESMVLPTDTAFHYSVWYPNGLNPAPGASVHGVDTVRVTLNDSLNGMAACPERGRHPVRQCNRHALRCEHRGRDAFWTVHPCAQTGRPARSGCVLPGLYRLCFLDHNSRPGADGTGTATAQQLTLQFWS